MKNHNLLFNIGIVERETGIGKDTLRVWERRYGFPFPLRDEGEERLYPEDQVDRLRLIKRLLDSGMRPAKVVGLGVDELNALLNDAPQNEPMVSADLLKFIHLIKTHQVAELRLAFNRVMFEQGLNEFLSKTISPLNHLVGDAWLRGEIRVFEEHLYSEQIAAVLNSAIVAIRDPNGTPRVLLTTLPGEEHTLGLLMAKATMSMCGANCVMLGVQTPINEIVLAAKAHKSDVVTLSFSSAMSAAQVKAGIEQLRQALPKTVALWVGGSGVARQRKAEDGVKVMGPLSDLTDAVSVWREARH
jgi:MerR family transcriptional regulator, light-induced transcriptional regulator